MGRGSRNKRREEIGNGLGQWAEKGFWARIGKWIEKKRYLNFDCWNGWIQIQINNFKSRTFLKSKARIWISKEYLV
jgi:hypothetical protein